MIHKLVSFLIICCLSLSVLSQEETEEPQQKLMAMPDYGLSEEHIQRSLDMQRRYMELSIDLLTEPETANALAKFARGYYEALISQGFTKDEALQIISGLGFGLVPGRATSSNHFTIEEGFDTLAAA